MLKQGNSQGAESVSGRSTRNYSKKADLRGNLGLIHAGCARGQIPRPVTGLRRSVSGIPADGRPAETAGITDKPFFIGCDNIRRF